VSAMKIIKRVVSALLALAALLGVVQLCALSGRDDNLLVWSAIACAIAAPIGLALCEYAFSGDRRN